MKYIKGFFMAWGMFCSIPCPRRQWDEDARHAMLSMFPLIGLVLGVAVGICWYVMELIGLPPAFIGVMLTAIYFYLTGFIHIDGFMDCSDALLSRRPDMDERQRILKDSHVGAFAVISLLFVLLMFSASMSAICVLGFSTAKAAILCMIFVLSRSIAAYDVINKPSMNTSQYTVMREAGRGGSLPLIILSAVLSVCTFAVILFVNEDGIANRWGSIICGFPVVCVMQVFEKQVGRNGRAQLGGMSGDISGYMVVSGETCGVVMMAIGLFLVGSYVSMM